MEVAHLETIYSASISDLERKSSIADSRLKHTATQAKSTERAVSQAFSFHNLPAADTKLARTTSSVKGLTNAVTPATTSATALSSSVGAIAGISVIATTAVAGLAKGIFDLAQKTAAYGGHLQDLHDQTGIGVENLSALKLAFDDSGGSIDSGATALARYLRSVSDANTGNAKLRQKFLDVGFTVADLNAAYGDSDKAIELLVTTVGKYSNSQDRLNALQKLGVRNGQELNGAIVEMRGNLAEFRKEAERLGLVITPEQAQAADDFDESLNLLTKQIKGMGFSIAHQYLPQISGAISDVSQSLAANKNSWSLWGSFINTEIRGIRVAMAGLAGFLRSFSVTGMLGLGVAEGVADAIKKSRQLHLQDSFSVDASVGAGVFRSKGLGISGGGGGAGRRTRTAVDPSVGLMARLSEELQKLADSYDDVDTSTRSYAISQEIANGALKKASPNVQNHARLIGQQVDMLTRAMKINDQVTAFQKNQNEQVRLAIEGERDHIEVVAEFIKSLETEDTKIDETVKHWLRFNATVLQFSEDMERLNDILNDMPDNIGIFSVPEFDPNVIGQRLEDMFGPPPAARSEERMRQMQDVAAEIGFVFGDLFDSIGRGWEDLWQNMLNIARNIGNRIVSDIFTGLLEGLFNVPMGQRSGGISGLISGRIQGRADGGPVSAGQLYRINERGQEFFRPSGSGEVIPLGGQSGNSRFIFVDDERAAQERRSASDRNYIIRMRRMRKVGKLVPAF